MTGSDSAEPRPALRFWIDGVSFEPALENRWAIDARRFDPDTWYDHPQKRFYEGEVLYLGKSGPARDRVLISGIHTTRYGYFNTLAPEHPDRIPEAPFLLTTDLDTREVFAGTLVLEAAAESADFMDSLDPEDTLLVGSADWIGIARVVAAGSPVLRLTAFGHGESVPAEGQSLIEMDTGDHLGRIRTLQP